MPCSRAVLGIISYRFNARFRFLRGCAGVEIADIRCLCSVLRKINILDNEQDKGYSSNEAVFMGMGTPNPTFRGLVEQRLSIRAARLIGNIANLF